LQRRGHDDLPHRRRRDVPQRAEERIAAGEASLTQLVAETGLAKSTVHHHLAQLRSAGLITVRGNARGLWYALSKDGITAGRTVLTALFDSPPG
jgi:DNA-binding transcriptional ArsR family regulator